MRFSDTSVTVSIRGKQASTTTLHNQNPPRHYASHIWLTDENDEVVQYANTTDSEASQTFSIPTSAKELTGWIYCNLHGLYKGPTYVVAYQQVNPHPHPPDSPKCNHKKIFT